MPKEYNGEEINSALRILINTQQQTHGCVKDLGKDVKRNTALVVANGVKLDTAIEYNKECDKRLTGVEIWKAEHEGEEKGEEKRASKFNSKTTLLCIVGGFILSIIVFWFTTIRPSIDINTGLVFEIKSIKDQLSALEILE